MRLVSADAEREPRQGAHWAAEAGPVTFKHRHDMSKNPTASLPATVGRDKLESPCPGAPDAGDRRRGDSFCPGLQGAAEMSPHPCSKSQIFPGPSERCSRGASRSLGSGRDGCPWRQAPGPAHTIEGAQMEKLREWGCRAAASRGGLQLLRAVLHRPGEDSPQAPAGTGQQPLAGRTARLYPFPCPLWRSPATPLLSGAAETPCLGEKLKFYLI